MLSNPPRILLTAACVLSVACLPARSAPPATRPAAPERIPYLRAHRLGDLSNKEVDESSGLAAGRRNPGVLWTHNDSGGKARLYACNAAGEDLATLDVAGATNYDWEDLCSVQIGNKYLLLVADTGNNLNLPRPFRIYVLGEPKLDPNRRGVKLKANLLQVIHCRFADGWFDCESLAADPIARRIYLVSKPRKEGQVNRVYELAWPAKPGQTVWVAKPLAALMRSKTRPMPNTTAMDLSPDGLRAVVLTYGHVYEYARGPGENWAQAFARPGREILLPARRQGEAVCYGPDGKTLYLTSEGKPCPLWRVSPGGMLSRPAKPGG